MTRSTIVFIMLCLNVIPAFAGTPDQDPVVALMRKKFLNAQIPSIPQLQMGKTWQCSWFSAERDSYGVVDNLKVFKFNYYLSEIIRNDLEYYSTIFDFLYPTGPSPSFVGRPRANLSLEFYIRISDGKNLMAELVSPRSASNKYVQSISSTEHHVYSYFFCALMP